MRRSLLSLGAAGLLSLLLAAPARGSDHRDARLLAGISEGDLTDLYAWMSPDAAKLNLAIDWEQGATLFSDAVVWVVRVESKAAFGAAAGTETKIVCSFDAAQRVSCWLGDEYASGDGKTPGGVASASGRLRVFAGPRNDPFFFNRAGFTETLSVAKGLGGTPSDGAGCPKIDANTAAAVADKLKHGASGGAAKDDFAGLNVLALVIQVDKSLVTSGGPVLGISAATYKKVMP